MTTATSISISSVSSNEFGNNGVWTDGVYKSLRQEVIDHIPAVFHDMAADPDYDCSHFAIPSQGFQSVFLLYVIDPVLATDEETGEVIDVRVKFSLSGRMGDNGRMIPRESDESKRDQQDGGTQLAGFKSVAYSAKELLAHEVITETEYNLLLEYAQTWAYMKANGGKNGAYATDVFLDINGKSVPFSKYRLTMTPRSNDSVFYFGISDRPDISSDAERWVPGLEDLVFHGFRLGGFGTAGAAVGSLGELRKVARTAVVRTPNYAQRKPAVRSMPNPGAAPAAPAANAPAKVPTKLNF